MTDKTTITDDMCRAAIEAGKPDRVQGFTYEINGQMTHVVRDLTKPVGDSAHKLWVGSSHPEMMERCAIERMRLQLAAALAAPSPASAAPSAAQPDGCVIAPAHATSDIRARMESRAVDFGIDFDEFGADEAIDALYRAAVAPYPAAPAQPAQDMTETAECRRILEEMTALFEMDDEANEPGTDSYTVLKQARQFLRGRGEG